MDFVTPVARASPVPLYEQIAGQIRREIITGRLKPGDRLPAHVPLSSAYGVGLSTAAQALKRLVEEGYAITRPGGTFVAFVDDEEETDPTVANALAALSNQVRHLRRRLLALELHIHGKQGTDRGEGPT